MTTASDEPPCAAPGVKDGPLPPYEAPRVTWAEPYEPVGLAVSCNHAQGDPGCYPGPLGA